MVFWRKNEAWACAVASCAIGRMSRKYKFHDQHKMYFISYAVVSWIDVFIREDYRKVWIDSARYCQDNKGLEIYAWCLMTSHAHMIIGTSGMPMENIVRDMKKHTSAQLKKAIADNMQESRREWMLEMMKQVGKQNSNNTNFQFWQQHNQPLEIKNHSMFIKCLDYIHMNPVVAGFVNRAEDWIYSSADGYAKNKGLLKLHYP